MIDFDRYFDLLDDADHADHLGMTSRATDLRNRARNLWDTMNKATNLARIGIPRP